jgi:TRAP-type C4-dicarboxylate transport system permease small subunit
MNAIKLVAILLIVVGILALGYGGFTYTKETHNADIGPLHLQVNEKEHVNIPLWAGIGALVGGALLLVGGSRKS